MGIGRAKRLRGLYADNVMLKQLPVEANFGKAARRERVTILGDGGHTAAPDR